MFRNKEIRSRVTITQLKKREVETANEKKSRRSGRSREKRLEERWYGPEKMGFACLSKAEVRTLCVIDVRIVSGGGAQSTTQRENHAVFNEKTTKT